MNKVRSIRPSARRLRDRRISAPGRRQLAQYDGRNDRAGLDGGFQPHQLGPLSEDRRRFDGVADQRHKQRPVGGFLDRVKLAILQILDPGREPVSQQMAKTEHVIRRSCGVGVVLGDAEIGLVRVMVQPVEHIGRFAHRRRNDTRVERSIMAGDVRVDDRAGVDAIFGIDGAARPRATSGPEILPV